MPNVPPTANTLRPPWAHLARLGWILFTGACLTIFILGLLKLVREPLPRCTPPEAPCPATILLSQEDIELAAELGISLPFKAIALVYSLWARLSLALVGIIIFLRRSDSWVAMMISAALMSVLLEGTHSLGPNLDAFLALLLGIGTALFLPIPFIFPSGRFVPAWTRLPALALTAAYTILVIFFLTASFSAVLSAAITLAWVILAVYAMVYRYRRVSGPAERQQIKWVLFGIGAALVSSLFYVFSLTLYPASQPSAGRLTALLVNGPVYAGGYSLFALAMLVSMLRYRLWDIDVVIRRTLLYTVLAGLLALTYYGGVVLLQGILSPLAGDSESPLVTVITTLGIASLFNPLRQYVQEFIDRRFYRQKYNAEQALVRFTNAARDEVDIDRLTGALTGIVHETMRPLKVSLWLAEDGQ